jgi:hypothetical protein
MGMLLGVTFGLLACLALVVGASLWIDRSVD